MCADSRRNELGDLHEMLASAKQVIKYVGAQTFEQFWDDAKTRDAVAMRLTVIGEAASKLSPALMAKAPDIPFHQIRGMRNRIAHSYGKVDFREVWQVTQRDLKPLVTELEKLLRRLEQTQALEHKISQAHHLRIPPPSSGPRLGM